MDTIQEVVEAVRQRRVDEQVIVAARNIPDEALKGIEFLTANLIRAVGGANPDPARRRDVNDALYDLLPQHRKIKRQMRRKALS